MKGDIVEAPDGSKVELVDIGQVNVFENERVRVWDVALAPDEIHQWHLHLNPYVVLSVEGSTGRMDWLDGREPRHIEEYTGGAVFRPTSPVHRLTNTGTVNYRNRLVELKDLGENRDEIVDVGAGARSVQGVIPPELATPSDGRVPVMAAGYASVWTIELAPGSEQRLDLSNLPHVFARYDTSEGLGASLGVSYHDGGSATLTNPSSTAQNLFVVELTYLADSEVA